MGLHSQEHHTLLERWRFGLGSHRKACPTPGCSDWEFNDYGTRMLQRRSCELRGDWATRLWGSSLTLIAEISFPKHLGQCLVPKKTLSQVLLDGHLTGMTNARLMCGHFAIWTKETSLIDRPTITAPLSH